MIAVLTRVTVEEGSIPGLAALFDETNRELVARHPDWLGAWFTANHETSEVTVIARWTNAEAYEALRSSEEYVAVISRFALKFVGPPDVSINEVLVEM